MSRYDDIGMFWEDVHVSGRGGRTERPMPAIPDTGWTPPTEFPNLSSARALGFDLETYDPELDDAGPGWGRGVGHIVGLSVAVPDGPGWYFPIRHETEPHYNLDPNTVLRWASYVLGDTRPKIGANLLYDVGWLKQEGVEVGGPLYDIQLAEPLLNSEIPEVSLEALARAYLGAGKETSILYQWLADWFGGNPTGKQRKWIYKAPPRLVGPYAEADAKLPLKIIEKQWAALERRGSMGIFDMECRLQRLLLIMRWQGVAIDLDEAHAFHGRLSVDLLALEKELAYIAGREVNPYSSEEIAAAFNANEIPFNRTATNRPSFTAGFLEACEHPIAQKIVEIRKKRKLRDVFIQGYILDSHRNGRIYCQFHQLRGDENGARSGRFSSSTPNLQNIPVRSKEGRLIRNIFIARELWRKRDYSQIEYRLLAHHAVGPGAEAMRQRYISDPSTDYHLATIDLVRTHTGIELDRRSAKNINFGLVYGMSRKGLIRYLGLGDKQGQELYISYHHAVPYVKTTIEAAENEVITTGTVTTIGGRKSDFPYFVPVNSWGDENEALPLNEALVKYGGSLQRAFTHKALNRKLQGGAADIMKRAMVEAFEQGIFDDTGYPLLTVHDELDFDDVGDPSRPSWDALGHVMENSTPTLIPILVDEKTGPNWGACD